MLINAFYDFPYCKVEFSNVLFSLKPQIIQFTIMYDKLGLKNI